LLEDYDMTCLRIITAFFCARAKCTSFQMAAK
jgi:hypothetical protein